MTDDILQELKEAKILLQHARLLWVAQLLRPDTRSRAEAEAWMRQVDKFVKRTITARRE